jgi:hypothetical protein
VAVQAYLCIRILLAAGHPHSFCEVHSTFFWLWWTAAFLAVTAPHTRRKLHRCQMLACICMLACAPCWYACYFMIFAHPQILSQAPMQRTASPLRPPLFYGSPRILHAHPTPQLFTLHEPVYTARTCLHCTNLFTLHKPVFFGIACMTWQQGLVQSDKREHIHIRDGSLVCFTTKGSISTP